VTTALILVPLAAALIVAFTPSGRRTTEGLALLGALGTAALAVVALLRFELDEGAQFVTNRLWIEDFVGGADVRFHVAMGGLSLFMVLLTTIGVAAAVAAAVWTGRSRPRGYFFLLLSLDAALVLLFTAQDLVLFYAGWEAMMIPLYVLMGGWGGEGRRRATYVFVVYTLIGSLLMLVAIAAIGVQQGTFSIQELSAPGRDNGDAWLFAAFVLAFCIKAPLFPLHGWLPGAYRQAPVEVTALLSGVVSKAGAYGLIFIAVPLFRADADRYQWWILGPALAGLLIASLVAFRQPDARGIVAYSSVGQMNLVVIGIFALNANGLTGAQFQMVNHGVVSLAAFLLIGLVELRAGTDALAALGGLANRRPVASTVFLIAALFALAVPGSCVFVSELYVLIGAFEFEPLLGAAGALAIVLAAMYMLRWYSAIAHEDDGARIEPGTADLQRFELGIAVPLVLILLAMSAYPFGVMERIAG
jgi:NADH-quinone oxidoreductase subunit M